MSQKGHRMFSAQRIAWSVFGVSAARSYNADVRARYVGDPRIRRRRFGIGFDGQHRMSGVPLPHCGRPRCVFESGDDPAPQCLAPLRCLSGHQRSGLHVVSHDAFFARLFAGSRHFRSITTSRYSLGSTSVRSPERLRVSMRASKSSVKAICFSASSAPKVLFIGP